MARPVLCECNGLLYQMTTPAQSGTATCAGPNCGRMLSQINAVGLSSCWSPVSRIPEQFGEARRDGAGRIGTSSGRAGVVPVRRGGTSPDARHRSLRSSGETGPTAAHRDGGVEAGYDKDQRSGVRCTNSEGRERCRIVGERNIRRSDDRSATFAQKCDQSVVKDR
jgi:hypothetical protein